MYYYEPCADVDAISSATAKTYLKSGYGPTYIDGKVIDATFLHLKEWIGCYSRIRNYQLWDRCRVRRGGHF